MEMDGGHALPNTIGTSFVPKSGARRQATPVFHLQVNVMGALSCSSS
jgi:hypothetical protein